MSEAVPVLVPTTRIEAPTIGSPSSWETTVPEIWVCANAIPKLRNRQAKNILSLFSIKTSLVKKYVKLNLSRSVIRLHDYAKRLCGPSLPIRFTKITLVKQSSNYFKDFLSF